MLVFIYISEERNEEGKIEMISSVDGEAEISFSIFE